MSHFWLNKRYPCNSQSISKKRVFTLLWLVWRHTRCVFFVLYCKIDIYINFKTALYVYYFDCSFNIDLHNLPILPKFCIEAKILPYCGCKKYYYFLFLVCVCWSLPSHTYAWGYLCTNTQFLLCWLSLGYLWEKKSRI